MNKSKLKSYAPQARNDFIAMVTSRANQLGISEAGGQLQIESCTVQGDVALIGGQAYPAKVAQLRQRLLARIKQHGFGETMEAIAYTWFNRFAALRYMELHDYLGHGQRVLSSINPDSLPDILTHALELVEAGDLPGIKSADVADLKLAGKDGELYKRLLVAQCNKLASVMPFLFERIDDDSELLLPDNLLRTDSVIRKLVDSIDEADWQQVEIIGWLYQFYISEKKDQVIGKVVKSEDIPAATQLFTPNWIVKYMVQNSVGRLWLQANPQSTLASQWEYYIQPAEQTPEVQAQLDALIQTRVAEDGDSPESITVLDPACGSGHILVEAYEVLKGIYLERGYQARSIPRLILEKNLYGLDIDDRAAQLAGFALLMKARADDRRLLETPVKLNVLSLQESAGMELDEFAGHLKPHGINRTVLGALLDTLTHAKTFGSLIQIPKVLEDGLACLEDGMSNAIENGDVFAKAAARDLVPLVQQAKILARKFDAVVANPPYMGGKYFSAPLKPFVLKNYLGAKGDLYACFIFRAIDQLKDGGRCGMITIPNWMFISSFENVRHHLILKAGLETFVHNGRGVFGSDFGSCSMTFAKSLTSSFKGKYFRLFDRDGSVSTNDEIEQRYFEVQPYLISANEFEKIPGAPMAYWASIEAINVFRNVSLASVAELRAGITTGDNDRFVRYWHEVNFQRLALGRQSGSDVWAKPELSWVPLKSGGAYRKWFGNNEKVLKYDRRAYLQLKATGNGCASEDCYFKPGLTWSDISGYSSFGVRKCDPGFVFTTVGHSLFAEDNLNEILGFLCSNVAAYLAGMVNPTIHANPGDIGRLPFIGSCDPECASIVERLVVIARNDWNYSELSWGFEGEPIIQCGGRSQSIKATWDSWLALSSSIVGEAKALEEKNNHGFVVAYGLERVLSSSVPDDQITLTRADREKDSQRLISYAIGCMMGRYSLDEPGLIYAHAGNVGFDTTHYKTFPADADGIIPITDELWFEDDAANRIREFLLAVWPAPTLDENMAWLAESLGTKGNETPAETIRRYLASNFFKDHLQTYKKRPIYWLFSSGKHKAFEALVYLHRYNEGTLARMRAEYVVPLTGKMADRIKLLEDDAIKASTPAARKKIDKDIEKLKKKLDELRTYDEKLRHYADMRISLDLDDGVKVNYGKFGDLLAEVKSITGGSGDD